MAARVRIVSRVLFVSMARVCRSTNTCHEWRI
jgi:hypothetical protein